MKDEGGRVDRGNDCSDGRDGDCSEGRDGEQREGKLITALLKAEKVTEVEEQKVTGVKEEKAK